MFAPVPIYLDIYMRRMLKFVMHFNNLYGEIGNPLFNPTALCFNAPSCLPT